MFCASKNYAILKYVKIIFDNGIFSVCGLHLCATW